MPRSAVRRRRTIMHGLASVISNHPVLIVATVAIVNIAALIGLILSGQYRSFSDLQTSLEHSESLINQRSVAWRTLLRVIGSDSSDAVAAGTPLTEIHHSSPNAPAVLGQMSGMPRTAPTWSLAQTVDYPNGTPTNRERETFFCRAPAPTDVKLIVGSMTGANLLSLESLRLICELDQEIRGHFPDASHSQCPSWNLANYIFALSGKTNCVDLSENDLDEVRKLAALCLPVFRPAIDWNRCNFDATFCGNAMEKCRLENHPNRLLPFISDDWSLESNFTVMRFAMNILPFPRNQKSIEKLLYIAEDLKQRKNDIQILGIEMEESASEFRSILFSDLKYSIGTTVAAFILLWIATGSFLIAFFSIFRLIFSGVGAFIFYSSLLQLEYFPTTNFCAFIPIFVMEISHTLLLMKIRRNAKCGRSEGHLNKVIVALVRDGGRQILLAALLVSAVVICGLISTFIAVRCFCLFTVIATVFHVVLVTVSFPAVAAITEKWESGWSVCQRNCDISLPVNHLFYWLRTHVCDLSCCLDCLRIFFEKILPCIVIRLKWFWTTLFFAMTSSAIVALVLHPGIKFHTETEPTWTSDHLGEKFKELKGHFPLIAEKYSDVGFVWGISTKYTHGFFSIPSNTDHIEPDESFHIDEERDRFWMSGFCEKLNTYLLDRRNDYGISSVIMLYSSQHPDLNVVEDSMKNCSAFFDASQVHQVSQTLNDSYSQQKYRYFVIKVRLKDFPPKNQENMAGSMVEWFLNQTAEAQPGLQHGWFFSPILEKADLRNSLERGSFGALIVIITLLSVLTLLLTRNLVVSLLSIILIASNIAATCASFILLGWQIGVLESVIALSISGLSAAFVLQVSLSYCRSKDGECDREMRANFAVIEMGNPLFVTTLISISASAFLVPSQVLIYQRIAHGLLLSASINLLYSGVFLPALLAIIGPEGDFCQFRYPSIQPICCRTEPSKLVEKGIHSSMDFPASLSNPRLGNCDEPKQRTGQMFATQVQFKSEVETSTTVVPVNNHSPPKFRIERENEDEDSDELDAVPELGSVPQSRGPSRGSSLIRRQGSKSKFSWDFVTSKLPLSRHFSYTGSSVIYIDADVRSNLSEAISDVPVVLPNKREEEPEVWVRRTD